jgi:hypothetical protein
MTTLKNQNNLKNQNKEIRFPATGLAPVGPRLLHYLNWIAVPSRSHWTLASDLLCFPPPAIQ